MVRFLLTLALIPFALYGLLYIFCMLVVLKVAFNY